MPVSGKLGFIVARGAFAAEAELVGAAVDLLMKDVVAVDRSMAIDVFAARAHREPIGGVVVCCCRLQRY